MWGSNYARFPLNWMLFAYTVHRDGGLSPVSTALSTFWTSVSGFVYAIGRAYRLVDVSKPFAVAS